MLIVKEEKKILVKNPHGSAELVQITLLIEKFRSVLLSTTYYHSFLSVVNSE